MALECKIEIDIDSQTPLDIILKYDADNGVYIHRENKEIEHLDNWVTFCGLDPYTGNYSHGTNYYDSWLFKLLIAVYECSDSRAKEICVDALKQIYAQRQVSNIQFHANGDQAFTDKVPEIQT